MGHHRDRKQHVCPDCGARWTRRSRSRLVSLWRRLMGAHTRYCPACGCRWSETRDPSASIWRKAVAAVMVFGVVATLALGAIEGDPKAWFKRRVVDVYQIVYGENHQQKLHEHLGSFYSGIGEEMDDYAGHLQD